MSLQAEPLFDIPELTAEIAGAAFPKGNIYMQMRDNLGVFFDDEQFTNLFSHTGRPAIAPWRLALVTIMQFALAQRFEFYFTPNGASWLNMIEIEFSALARLCLNRRIPTIEKLESEVLALIAERREKGIKINWQASIEACREKLNTRYSVVNDANSKFKKD